MPTLYPEQQAAVWSKLHATHPVPGEMWFPKYLLPRTEHMCRPIPSDLKGIRQIKTFGTNVVTNFHGLEAAGVDVVLQNVLPTLPPRLLARWRVVFDGDGKSSKLLWKYGIPADPEDADDVPAPTALIDGCVIQLCDCLNHLLKNVRKAINGGAPASLPAAATLFYNRNPAQEGDSVDPLRDIFDKIPAAGIASASASASSSSFTSSAVSSTGTGTGAAALPVQAQSCKNNCPFAIVKVTAPVTVAGAAKRILRATKRASANQHVPTQRLLEAKL